MGSGGTLRRRPDAFPLLRCHETAFSEWVNFPLETQKREVEVYLNGRAERVGEILGTWLRLHPFSMWIPAHARSAERTLFLADLDVLLELIRRDFGVAAPDPDA